MGTPEGQKVLYRGDGKKSFTGMSAGRYKQSKDEFSRLKAKKK
jgi:hypothetical protein